MPFSRRDFLKASALASVAFASLSRSSHVSLSAAVQSRPFTLHLVGQFGILNNGGTVYVPGPYHGVLQHVPFALFAADDPFAQFAGSESLPAGTVPQAFHSNLTGSEAAYRAICLSQQKLVVDAGPGMPAGSLEGTLNFAELHSDTGYAVRSDLTAWQKGEIEFRGGTFSPGPDGMPDSGQKFRFERQGGQPYDTILRDTVTFEASRANVTLAGQTLNLTGGRVWVISAAVYHGLSDPKYLNHGLMLYEFLQGGIPTRRGYGPSAVGRMSVQTAIPCTPVGAAHADRQGLRPRKATVLDPPNIELCFSARF